MQTLNNSIDSNIQPNVTWPCILPHHIIAHAWVKSGRGSGRWKGGEGQGGGKRERVRVREVERGRACVTHREDGGQGEVEGDSLVPLLQGTLLWLHREVASLQ